MKKLASIILSLFIVCGFFVSLAFAGGEGYSLDSPFTSYGAETYSALNLFKAVFPDTRPGGEEWYLNINWTADPYRGYLSMPLSLPGYGKYTSEKLDTFMQRAGVPVINDQYALYGIGDRLIWTAAYGLKGDGAFTEIQPADDYAQVMAKLTPGEISTLARNNIWQINPRQAIPRSGSRAESPGWLTEYYFLPPDLQVKDLQAADGKATAVFYNNCNFGGTTDIYFYRISKGNKELIKEQEVTLKPWETITICVDYNPREVEGIAASIARPWTGTEWGYGKFTAENGIFKLDGYAVETGNGAYPQKTLELLKSKWNNNIKEATIGSINLKVANFSFSANPAAPGETVAISADLINESAESVTTKVRGIFKESVVAEKSVTIPGKGKIEFYFTITAPSPGSYSAGVYLNPYKDAPANETTFNDNYSGSTLLVEARETPDGGGDLIFRAISQNRQITRSANTAKWTDWVTAELRPPAPDPPRGSLDWWKITSAELTYPRKNPEFTFGTPYPPVGTKTVKMSPNGHVATVEFQEDWGMDGAKIYSILEKKMMAEYPKNYTLTARYTIKYQYSWTECDEDGCWTETRTATTSGTISGNLLVNGTGVDSRAQ